MNFYFNQKLYLHVLTRFNNNEQIYYINQGIQKISIGWFKT